MMAEGDFDREAPGLTDEDRAWIAETEKQLEETQKKIEAGEIDAEGWNTANWKAKTQGFAPEETPNR